MQLEQLNEFSINTEDEAKASMPTYTYCKKELSTETELDDISDD